MKFVKTKTKSVESITQKFHDVIRELEEHEFACAEEQHKHNAEIERLTALKAAAESEGSRAKAVAAKVRALVA